MEAKFEPPDWLGKHGKAKYSEMANALGATVQLPAGVLDQLALYAEAYDDFRTALEEVASAKGGATCISEKGSPYLHPAVGRKNRAYSRMRQLGASLGWSETKAATGKKPSGVSARKRKS